MRWRRLREEMYRRVLADGLGDGRRRGPYLSIARLPVRIRRCARCRAVAFREEGV